jgi:hypothetical protein
MTSLFLKILTSGFQQYYPQIFSEIRRTFKEIINVFGR